jgi:DNA-binding NarL/FixJ family response regulator
MQARRSSRIVGLAKGLAVTKVALEYREAVSAQPSLVARANADEIRVSLLAIDPIRGRRVANLLAESEVALVARASSPDALADVPKAASANVVIAAFDDFGPEEANVVAALRERFPQARPLTVVAAAASPKTVRDVLEAGAQGLLTEDDLSSRLLPALHAVAAGLVVLPSELWRTIGRPKLTPREKQIMAMVVMGFTNREIANRLFVAETTVKSHLSSAFEKLGVRSRQAAAELILDSEAGLGTGILAISGPDEQ